MPNNHLKEPIMSKGVAVAAGFLMVGLLAILSGPVFGDEKVSTRPVEIDKPPVGTGDAEKDKKCDTIADPDERNLCRALTRDSYNDEKEKQNRYANKDHSYYYCTLVKDRDKQTYCYALIRNQKSMCGNIIDAKLEKECNEKIQ